MKILFIGDIFGSPGRAIISETLPSLKKQYAIDLVIANAENSAHGKGLTPKIYKSLMSYGIDFFTMGNHTWSKEEILEVLDKEENIIRPLNLKPGFPYYSYGVGSKELICKNLKIRISNLLGSSVNFKDMQLNAFTSMEKLLSEIEKPDIHIVDFHSETTAEKYAFLWAFNGKVNAILGTHTHVPTADACITKEGTAFICDVGMTGPSTGVIGGFKETIVQRFFNPSSRFILEVQKGPRQFSSVLLEYDESQKRITSIEPITIREGFQYLANPWQKQI